MKQFIFFLLFITLLFISFPTLAGKEDVIKAHFKVSGECEMCKSRIEDAAYIKGVKYAEWKEQEQMLNVSYDTTKTNSDLILNNVAKAGHDNEKFKAPDDAYNKIPKCCKYRTLKK